MKSLSENIRLLRTAANLKQSELAEMLGKAPSVIANWEAGTNLPSALCIEKMCSIFKTDANTIFGWDSTQDEPVFQTAEASMVAKAYELAPENIRRATLAMLEPYMSEIAQEISSSIATLNKEETKNHELEKLHATLDGLYRSEKTVEEDSEVSYFGKSGTA